MQVKESQETRSKLIQIFRYLQALNQLRNPIQDEIAAQPWVLWLHDLPQHACVRRGVINDTVESSDEEDASTGDDFILKVSRPTLTPPPTPPKEIVPWLLNGWQHVEGKVVVAPTIDRGVDGQTRSINFSDDPRRPQLLAEWKPRRDSWATTERPAQLAYGIFEKLYALQNQLERESERLELMVGDGLLNWQPENATAMHHPILLLRLQMHFDPDIPEFTLVDAGQPSELYTAIFQSNLEVNIKEIASSRYELTLSNQHPLAGEETTRFLRRFINGLTADGEFLEEDALPKKKQAPVIRRDPVIFLRPRTLGMSAALEAVLETLPEEYELPYSLTSLTGIETLPNERQESVNLRSYESPNGEDENILLSKPANAEQLEIARRLEKYGAVLVQGPPGTGKTHTIANLIGHLLAQGKSVLVTSEKPKALRVLREQVVEPLQALCVSILEDDSRKQMESTIDAISERLSFSNADLLDREALALTRQRIEMLRQLREARQKLAEARSSEYSALVIAGQSFSPIEAARYVARNKETAAWLPGPLEPGAILPLTAGELLDLYATNAALTEKDEREMVVFLPECGKLLAPLDFEQIVREQFQLFKQEMAFRRNLWVVGTETRAPEKLQALQNRLVQAIEPLRDLGGWRLAAIDAGREGGLRRQLWEDLLNEIESVYSYAAQAQLRIMKWNPFVPQDCLPGRVEKVLDEMINYLAHGGKLGGFKLLTKREWKTLIESTRVNGKQPEELEHFQALKDLIVLWQMRRQLVDRWQRQMGAVGGPSLTTLGPEPEKTFHQFVDPLRHCLDWTSSTWLPLEKELKQQGFQWDVFLAEMPVAHTVYGEVQRLAKSVVERLPQIITAETQRRRYGQNEEKLLEIERTLAQVGSSTTNAEVVSQLREATKRRDVHGYSEAFARLADLHAKREVLRLRRTLLSRLEKVAPGWASAIRERIGVHGRQQVPGDAEDAWLWRQLQDELERRAKVSLEELQDKLTWLSKEVFRITAELVEKKAWAQKVRHTTVEQQRALQGWRALMKKVGKGTGKRAPRLLAEARKLMPICQTAVPVWIMPLSYVAKNFDMHHNRFDVVIIDEASQADITALIAVFMGKQVVVVGDHEQVSPDAVGQQVENVNHLIDEHLRGVPLAEMYDGKLSIYDLAKTTFRMVCLLEHFRCVSPIIQFSNELSYGGKIRPLRDDSEVQRRPATVAYRVKSASKSGKVNQEEALAIASLLLAATEQPEYKDATFGVISLLGSEQALYIETLLRRYMPATEYIKRRVLCGDAAQFQGDERDVIFLSMVDVPSENGGPLVLRTEEGHEDRFKKRFNVAASRARDQMWVVYSLDPETDLKPSDIRRRLIVHARDQHIGNSERRKQEQKVESEFEKQVFKRLTVAGYRVTTQWKVGAYRIDMVVEGGGKRLAVECDGERWHSQEKLEEDMARQAILERLGWRFVRIRGSQFFRDAEKALEPVFARLRSLEIPPEGMVTMRSDNQDGSELKQRIVRRAEVLRQEWKELENPALPQAAMRYTRQNGGGSKSETLPVTKRSPT